MTQLEPPFTSRIKLLDKNKLENVYIKPTKPYRPCRTPPADLSQAPVCTIRSTSLCSQIGQKGLNPIVSCLQ